MELLLTLLLAHLLADFPLQTNTMAAFKNKSLRILAQHVLIHVAVLWALLGANEGALLLATVVGLAHFAVDWLKPRVLRTDTVQTFVLDQLAHLTCLLGVAVVATTFKYVVLHPIIDQQLLYLSLSIGVGQATMVFAWVWTNTLEEEIIQQNRHLRWSHSQLLILQQRAGLGLLCIIGLTTFLRG